MDKYIDTTEAIKRVESRQSFKEGFYIYEYQLVKKDDNPLIPDLATAAAKCSSLQWDNHNRNSEPSEKYYRLVFQNEKGELKFL